MDRLRDVLRPRRVQSVTTLDAPTAPRKPLRPLFGPRWLLFHLIAWGVAGAAAWLGHWQLDVSNRKHFDLQNFGYTLQWWAFAVFSLFLWLRVVQHYLRPPASVSAGTGLALTSRGGVALVGPVDLLAPASSPDAAPTVYRGYVMPQVGDRPVRSHGDGLHDAYNNYLWELALKDGEKPAVPPPSTPRFAPAPAPPADDVPVLDLPSLDSHADPS